MTPAARVQAAIEVLDQVRGGLPAEQALTGWARRSRYAGSGDRLAVRDHVFDVLRCWRTSAAAGGGETGRALMLGALRLAGADVEALFSGGGYAPAALDPLERAAPRAPQGPAEALDLPDWLWPRFSASLGARAEAAANTLRHRAPVHLRANLLTTDRAGAIEALARDGITASLHPACDTALEVTEGARRIRTSAAYQDGLVELQDAASQAVIAALPLRDGMRVLDYCAGGGGKTLAMAARARLSLFAHDAAPQRMRDLATRAARARARVTRIETDDLDAAAPFDLVLCDVPCSGSGAWRRAPEGKWTLTEDKLADLLAIQRDILNRAALLCAPDGGLAYATCSLLSDENRRQIDGFLDRNRDWTLVQDNSWPVEDGTDGFYGALLRRVRT